MDSESAPILTIWVPGIPAPQGSKRHVGRGVMIESSARVKPWRESIRAALLDTMQEQKRGVTSSPVVVGVEFVLPRPKGHFGTGRNADVLKPSAPAQHTTKPDVDKLLRAVLDAVTSAGVWRDDSQVWHVAASKRYAAPGAPPGMALTVHAADSADYPNSPIRDTKTLAEGDYCHRWQNINRKDTE